MSLRALSVTAVWVLVAAGCDARIEVPPPMNVDGPPPGMGQPPAMIPPGIIPVDPPTGGGTGGSGGTGGGSAGGGTTLPPARVPQFTCDAALVAPELPLRRLSAAEVRHAVQQVVGRAAPTSGAAVLTALEPVFTAWPADQLLAAPGEGRGGYLQQDQAVQQAHADALYELGGKLGALFTSSTARRTEVFGACATDTSTANDATCLDDFIRSFGARVLRRPMTADDVSFLRQPAATTPVDPAALADVVALILNSPEFFYAVEHGQPTAAAVADLGPYELANRLAFHFWQTPPDDALLAAAASGALLTEAGYRAQVERLSADARSAAALDDFFGHWLRLDATPELDTFNGTPQFAAFAGADLPTASTRAAVIADVLESARHQVAQGGSISDLLKDRHSYAKDAVLARLYGAAPWDGTSPAPEFGSPTRPGLVARAAFLVTGAAKTRPIHKGAFLRNALLCQVLPAPPASVNTTPPSPSATATTREAAETLTQTAGTSCAGCHKALINPLGFATEGFDGLGRARTEETIYDTDGKVLAKRAVNTASVPGVLAGDPTPSTGAGDLTRLLDDSGKVHSCVARQLFRFTASRLETPADGCALSRLEALALQNQPLLALWRETAMLPSFKQRRFSP